MKITPEQVRHVAELARLQIDPQAMEKLCLQVATVLDYIDTLNEVSTEGVAPTSHAIDLPNTLREDIVHTHLSPEEALANGPVHEEGFFVVPRII